jgi:outer membrane protein insertion porin family
MFPSGAGYSGAGDYTYKEVSASYGARNVYREPRKTFRFTVSTTF